MKKWIIAAILYLLVVIVGYTVYDYGFDTETEKMSMLEQGE